MAVVSVPNPSPSAGDAALIIAPKQGWEVSWNKAVMPPIWFLFRGCVDAAKRSINGVNMQWLHLQKIASFAEEPLVKKLASGDYIPLVPGQPFADIRVTFNGNLVATPMACWQRRSCLKTEGRSRVHVLSGSRPRVCIEMVQDKNRMNQDAFPFRTQSPCSLLWIVPFSFFWRLQGHCPLCIPPFRQMENQALSTCLTRQRGRASGCNERSFAIVGFDERSGGW